MQKVIDSLKDMKMELTPQQADHALRQTIEQLDRLAKKLRWPTVVGEEKALYTRLFNKMIDIRDLLILRNGYGPETVTFVRVRGSYPFWFNKI